MGRSADLQVGIVKPCRAEARRYKARDLLAASLPRQIAASLHRQVAALSRLYVPGEAIESQLRVAVAQKAGAMQVGVLLFQ